MVLSRTVLAAAAIFLLTASAEAKQWPVTVLQWCGSAITVQLDRNLSVAEPKGATITLNTTANTVIEGSRNSPSATVEFDPATRQVTHIWFQPSRESRPAGGCAGDASGAGSQKQPSRSSPAPPSRPQPAARQPAEDLWQEGIRLYQAGNMTAAAKVILEAAQAGHLLAQGQIGFQFEKGIGVARSFPQAAAWYRKAADQGDSRSMKNLGQLYELGLGVPEDWGEAARWYARSAEHGDRDGQTALARAYQFGIGVAQDRKTSIVWDERAAAQGDSQSAHYARWLRDPTNFIGFRNDEEQSLVMAGKLRFGVQLLGGDPAGILFRNSTERFAWLLFQRKALDRDEADTWWQIRNMEYDRCRQNHREYCREPGPRP
jgi:TPR repeat protein